MNNTQPNKKQSFATKDYILNQDIFYNDCYKQSNEKQEKIYAVNCGYPINSPNPTYPKCWDESKVIDNNSLVLQNIKNGGIIYDNKIRSNINSNIGLRVFSNQYVKSPCDYVKDVETEFYLLHGESTTCSKKEWKNRHSK